MPGATVRATQGERVLSTLTDANGEFKLVNLTPGTWTIDVAMFGFAPQRREVQIAASPTKIDFTLQIGNFAAGRGGFGAGRFGAGGRGGGGLARWRFQSRRESGEAAPNAAPDAVATGASGCRASCRAQTRARRLLMSPHCNKPTPAEPTNRF